jgi:hypothetical protein
MKAVLIQVGKSPMQAGYAKSEEWLLRFIPNEKIWFEYSQARWSGSSSTIKQMEMKFPDKSSALNFCKKNDISFMEIVQNKKKIVPKSYTETIMNS